jgi:quinol monooxygenase YgiN
MIIVIGSIIAKPENVSDVLALSLEHVQRSQKEPGCISHNVSIDCENPARFVFVEYWADMAALQVHFALEASQHFVRDLTPFAASKPDMKIYEAGEIGAR